MKKILVSILTIAVFCTVYSQSTTKIECTVIYTGKAITGSWKGQTIASGNLTINPLSGKICTKAESFSSQNEKRDSHMRDVLETTKYPLICFTPQSFDGSIEGGDITIKGFYELHGVTKPAEIKGNIVRNGSAFTFQGSSSINLSDFQIERPGMLGIKMNDFVSLTFQAKGSL